jgi:hypothetical protein
MSGICICGKRIDGGDDEWCSDRCKFIIDGLDSDLGHELGYVEAMIHFGGVWDAEHGGGLNE